EPGRGQGRALRRVERVEVPVGGVRGHREGRARQLRVGGARLAGQRSRRQRLAGQAHQQLLDGCAGVGTVTLPPLDTRLTLTACSPPVRVTAPGFAEFASSTATLTTGALELTRLKNWSV